MDSTTVFVVSIALEVEQDVVHDLARTDRGHGGVNGDERAGRVLLDPANLVGVAQEGIEIAVHVHVEELDGGPIGLKWEATPVS